MPSLGLYIQVPFCQTKCTYCNFHTGVVSSARFAPYADAVSSEIRNHSKLYDNAGVEIVDSLTGLSVDSAYIGGGTPSLLDPAHIANLLRAMRETFAWTSPEITLEADPETKIGRAHV